MAQLSQGADPCLAAADAALEARENAQKSRMYLGMSSIGDPCRRKLWYRFRWVKKERFNADTLKKFADGHRTEDLVIERLEYVDGMTVVAATGEGGQIGHSDLGGHFRGHQDGEIYDLPQAPKTPHILEVKCVSDKRLAAFRRLKDKHGEKATLKAWSEEYYAQAILYMHYRGFSRHYLVVASAGGRDWDSVRTDADDAEALRLIGKAENIINSPVPPERISTDPCYYICKMCAFSDLCHGSGGPEKNCRTCLHATPEPDGDSRWSCARWKRDLTVDEQRQGCPTHLFIPQLVPFEQIDAGEDWVDYQMPDGEIWRNGVAE